MIKIIRKDAENMMLLSNLKVGDTFRVGERIYILIKNDAPNCKAICLLDGKTRVFYAGLSIVPVNATLICEDVTVEMIKEREELQRSK